MMKYTLKLKFLIDNLIAIGEPISEKNQVFQLLGGLGPIVASLVVRKDDSPLHSVYSILLTHEQQIHVQNTILEEENIVPHLATQTWTTQPRRHAPRKHPSSFNTYFNSHQSHAWGRFGKWGHNLHSSHNNNSNNHCPQCQLYGKYGHMVASYYDMFDINFQGLESVQSK